MGCWCPAKCPAGRNWPHFKPHLCKTLATPACDSGTGGIISSKQVNPCNFWRRMALISTFIITVTFT
jgi:hypothetical protein